MGFAVATKGFATFDRRVVKIRWRRIAESPAKKAGLLVRKIAIRSIRRDRTKSGNRPSKPGKPPRTRAPGDPIRRIYSVPEMMGTRVMVGPLGFGDPNPVPELQELGGVRTGYFRRRSGVMQRDQRGKFLKQKLLYQRATVRFPQRPYMRPALAKVVPKLPAMWTGSFN